MGPWAKDWTLAGTAAFALLLSGCAGEMGSGQTLGQAAIEQTPNDPGAGAAGSSAGNSSESQIEVVSPSPQTSQSSDAAASPLSGAAEGYQLQGLSLQFQSGDQGSILSEKLTQVLRVTKPEKGAHVFMSCEGRSWAYADASQKVYELHAPSLKVTGDKNYCTLQVANGRFWSLRKKGSSTQISFGLFTEDQTRRATYTTTDLQIPSGVEKEDLPDRLMPLAVNTDNIVFSFGTVLQFYELVQTFDSQGRTQNSVALTQLDWDRVKKGDPIAASRVGRDYWIATKTHLHWLKSVYDEKGNKTGYTWKSQSLSFAGYSREALASLSIKGVGLFITVGEHSLNIHGRASLLLPDSISVSPDLMWEGTIRPLAEVACSGCHSPASGRPWTGSLEHSAWVGSWKAVLEDKIKSQSMPPRFSPEALSLTAEQRLLIINWLEAVDTELNGTLVNQSISPPASVENTQPEPKSDAEEKWEKDILPILTTNCLTSGCHSSASGTQIGTYQSFKESLDKVRGSLTDEPDVKQMPLNDPDALGSKDREAILSYIEDVLLDEPE